MRTVSSTISGVGMYLVHIRVCCNFLSGDSSKFAVVMAVSDRVIAVLITKHSRCDTDCPSAVTM